MREINFRVWHPKKKQMYFIDSLYFHGDGVDLVKCFPYGALSYEEFGKTELFYADDVVLMEYTGINDKLGNKIFEGDIVTGFGTNGVVEYFNNLDLDSGGSIHPGFYCKEWFEYKSEGGLSYHYGFDESQVIGNIHQNGELLNVK